jgi:RNA polymerase sigma factor (sigma-70 family)
MATSTSVVQRLRRSILRVGDDITDGELLGRFLAMRDGEAFESLVRRHSAMVLGVCRRVLGTVQDAEDAFQATFLVLVHKAHSIVPRDAVGHWLYGVAYRTALKARSLSARRIVKERQVKNMPRSDSASRDEHALRDLESLLDEELTRLPEKYQVPLVLCHLEGKSKREIARRLGVPEGTVSSRLARAREMLRRRLTRRGLSFAMGPLVAMLSRDAVGASVPASLLDSTIHAAHLCAAGKAAAPLVSSKVAALTQGVLKIMFLSKLKIVTAIVFCLGLAVSGLGIVTLAAFADAPKPEAKAAADGDKPKPKGDAKTNENQPPKPQGKGPSIVGVLDAVDADNGRITVAVKDKDGNDEKKTLELTREATVTVDGKETKLADLKKGARVRLFIMRVNKDDPPVVTGVSVEPTGTKPAGNGNNNNTPKPQGAGNSNTPKPQGDGTNNDTPKPAGNGGTAQPPK